MTDSDLPDLRLFVAIEPPAEWRTLLAEAQHRQDRATPGYFRWVKPELLHLTLVFLGNHPPERLVAITEAVRQSANTVRPFRLSLGRIGTFGPPRAPRVLWVEVKQPEDALRQLRAALENQLRAVGASFDEKPLVPHLTLGRARTGVPGPIRTLEQRLSTSYRQVSEIVLFGSQLSPHGPTYHRHATAPLGMAPDDSGATQQSGDPAS